MNNQANNPQNHLFKNLKHDIPSGFVVFLVAIPLCLGIAHATGLPLMSGLLAGIIGGLIVPLISNAQMAVSGPAAGLITIVIGGITSITMSIQASNPEYSAQELQQTAWSAFFLAVFLGGLIQLLMGLIKADTIAYFFPSSVVKGMLAAIGIILILKQIPHAIGYDVEDEGLLSFFVNDAAHHNTFSLIWDSIGNLEFGALIISLTGLAILIFWERVKTLQKLYFLPAALVVVVVGVLINLVFSSAAPNLTLLGAEAAGSAEESHLVAIPVLNGLTDFIAQFRLPDFSYITNGAVWFVAISLGIVGSLETLLTINAVDKIDPQKRTSSLNRELYAQGIANSIAGLIGALPITAVIVRSTAAISSGGRTRMTSIVHGVFLIVSVMFLGTILNWIPLASLAAILIMVGYKLAKPAVIMEMYRKGWNQFVPYMVTILAILFTNLLYGIFIGIAVGFAFALWAKFKNSGVDEGGDSTVKVKNDSWMSKFTLTHLKGAVKLKQNDGRYVLQLSNDVSFLNKLFLVRTLAKIPEGSKVTIDGSNSHYMDYDVHEVIKEYKDGHSNNKLEVETIGMNGAFEN